ncbi:MAG: LytTR family DNA-binding domain-containing protein [Bacteroidota bacterium]
MKVIIIEDEYYAAEKLKKQLHAIDPKIEVIAVIESGEGVLNFFSTPPPHDLILSDIHLADGLCFPVLARLELDAPIIFTTAYDKYALEAFETNGIDYLLKPIHPERLAQAIEKFQSLKSGPSQQDALKELTTMLSQQQKIYKSRFLCKLGSKITSIQTTETLYFYSKDKMTFLVNRDGKRFPINHTLDELDRMMDPSHFFKLNRQFLVHFDAIKEIHPHFKGRLKIKLPKSELQHEDIVVSTERSPLLKSWLDR